MSPLRIYSQNICCLPYGSRERYLQKGSIIGFFLVTSLFLFTFVSFPDARKTTATVWLVLSGTWLNAPLMFYSTLPFITLLTTILPGHHDYKLQRLRTLVDDKLTTDDGKPRYDAVCMQELFGCIYSDAARLAFVKIMFDAGYTHSALPSTSILSVFPSLWANSGLAIFSVHPLTDVSMVPYKSRLFYDYWTVQRGVLSTKCNTKDGTFWVASTHFGPPVSVLESFSSLPKFLVGLLDKYECQCEELVEVVKEWNESGFEGVIGGDFNAIVKGPDYELLKSRLAAQKMNLLWDGFESPNCPPTVNPPNDRLLTTGDRTPMVLDYMFCTKGLEGEVKIGGVAVEGK
eukprot:CAMPEP_0118640482 /NCGR_PEP_ID=MMETSP0785-20121206/4778_1 /TAXON_ID=91992 /ORGANISM="Bolidomonas pacifica, Strain CCMP 1866" /LENGTH=344 /DNA_ID=CAMNT_0006531875 /DNA_START=28 /DNA_END=1059 /DNA_ORIENTATION=-